MVYKFVVQGSTSTIKKMFLQMFVKKKKKKYFAPKSRIMLFELSIQLECQVLIELWEKK